jgi:hypothetical protein
MRDLAIHVTHRPGEIARVANALARKDVNIKSIAGLGMSGQGLIRLIADDIEAARAALNEGPMRGKNFLDVARTLAVGPSEAYWRAAVVNAYYALTSLTAVSTTDNPSRISDPPRWDAIKENMRTACLLVWLSGIYPLGRAWQANRQTSLRQAIYWVVAAWAAWGLAIASAASWPLLSATASCHLALSLTGCAAIAVLGARRPGATAWNFVVVALLAVDLLPLAESQLTGGVLQLNSYRLTCLAAPLAVGVLNYLPTGLAPAALALLLGCALELVSLAASASTGQAHHLALEAGWIALAFVPWIALGSLRAARPPASEFDRIWLDFRNRFGFVWAQRLREQFNRSVANAGWPVVLRWQGLRLVPGSAPPEPPTAAAMLARLRALLKRFDSDEKTTLSKGEEIPTESLR